MNRHQKFFAELEHTLDEEEYYDEEDYEEEYEEEYYNEEGEEYYDPEAAAAEARHAKVVNPHTCISPEVDADFELLDAMLPVLHQEWKEKAPRELPLMEIAAVEALRHAEYDVNSAVDYALERRLEGKKGQVKKALHVTGCASKHDESQRSNTEAATNDVSEAQGPSTLALGTSANAPKKSTKRAKGLEGLMPDASKPDCTFVIAGHVDSGKSTTLGHLLLLLGKVSMEDVSRNEQEAHGTNKESFKYAWLLDQSEEERRRGVTIDSGSQCFETAHRRVHILDAPGHKDYVLSMMSSATQADAALLVINASTSEFETGFAHGTRDHLLVLKTLGIGSIIVAVNKMDSVNYSKDRYNYIIQQLKLLFKELRIKESCIVGYCPVSGMSGVNLCELMPLQTPWYDGPCLIDLLDRCPLESRLLEAPLRLSLQDVQGSSLYAKVESGKLLKGDTLHFVPCDVKVAVRQIVKPTVGGVVQAAFAGEPVEISTNSNLVGLYPGCVGSLQGESACRAARRFEAHVQTFPTLQKAVIPGASFMMVAHALTVPVKVTLLVSKMKPSDGSWSKGMVKCVPAGAQAIVQLQAEQKVALENSEDCRALGRFILQQDGETVAGGLVKNVIVD
ncbi:elongation factor 1 alpha-like protein [Strigomonas culicis]|uniref:Elongation factor 1 alpha-like protein n=1 Tax=Strigomonas culicis TaxID=28005 RepID=S9TXM0_9TRYP|nr:elongation factor 1 alpha-like protein [Strigomonas culicis]|eukprot:EPY21388.1 elongation factor 1 alpha-like protein [Strigomonas culicis]